VADFVVFEFDDETSVMLEVFPAPAGLGGLSRDRAGADLPPTMGPVDPVGRPGELVERAGRTLAEVLRPLVPVLESVHKTVSTAVRPPDEMTVEVGLKLSSELHLAIVGGTGEASITVSATWRLGGSKHEEDRHADPGSPAT
jgi:hypothetical protein